MPSFSSFVDELQRIELEKSAGLMDSVRRAGGWLKSQYGHLGVAAGEAMMNSHTVSPMTGQKSLPLVGTIKNYVGNQLPKPAKPPGPVVSKIQRTLTSKPVKMGIDVADQVSEFLKLAEVKAYQQKTQYSCSAACLKAVLEHWGADRYAEHEVMHAIGVHDKKGAEVDAITKAAQQFGFEAYDKSFKSLEEAKAVTDQDIPIIADFQSFNNPGKGHYVVITKIDDNTVHLMDPNTDGNQRVITRAECEQRWWDRRMAAPHDLMPKWGVVVSPR
jgi:predicted double-glycine peptidase